MEASDYPMSIIIIGVGNANFEDMERLDADKKALQFNGRKASRDIVQFVPYRKYIGASFIFIICDKTMKFSIPSVYTTSESNPFQSQVG